MLNIVGIEYTDSKPMLLCQDENDKIGFYELPKGVMRWDPIPVKNDIKPINSVRYSINANA
tara:strand:+ start:6747 stop:6929 length:183 start_codon:yes stop_codon:yes gene_type:complete